MNSKIIFFLKENIKNNIQVNQTIFWLTILFIWKIFYWLTITYTQIFVVFFCVTLFDYIFTKLRTWKNTFPYSWINAWLWIVFFLRSADLIIFIFAAFVAIFTKHFFRIRWRHFLNPSNAAVFIILILFWQYAWVNSLQWWNYDFTQFQFWYIFAILLVLILWNIIIYRVKWFFKFNYLFDLILPYFILHSILFFVIPLWESWNSYYLFFWIPFFIHIFFMITDPKTVPSLSISRFFYSINLVFLFYILQFYINEAYSILWALFIGTLFLPLIWYLEEKRKHMYFFLTLTSIILIILLFNIYFLWRPDLVFDNICNKLFCK